MWTRKGRKTLPYQTYKSDYEGKDFRCQRMAQKQKRVDWNNNQGNELTETHNDDKLWDNRQVFQYGMKPADPNKPEGVGQAV